MQINGQTKVVGLIGDPVCHSLSPAMHNAAYQAMGLNYVYVPCQVAAAQLPAAVIALRALAFGGANVTVPYKEAVIPYLDNLDWSAKRYGAVNTIVNRSGTLTGYNTDGEGFIDSLRESGFTPDGKKAVILGAGGSARAIAVALLDNGAEIILINRTRAKAQLVADSLHPPKKASILALTPGTKPEISGAHLIVNTLSVSFRHGNNWLLDLSPAQGALFYDLRYGKMSSDFLVYAAELKSPGLNGLGMLLHQGARAFQLFTGQAAPLQIMREFCK